MRNGLSSWTKTAAIASPVPCTGLSLLRYLHICSRNWPTCQLGGCLLGRQGMHPSMYARPLAAGPNAILLAVTQPTAVEIRRLTLCPDCGGCTDDQCWGSCQERWCSGWYMGEGCDRCPEKVPKTITVTKIRNRQRVSTPMEIQVRCNAASGHKGIHHWDPWKAGR
jgi:hypothetical protein